MAIIKQKPIPLRKNDAPIAYKESNRASVDRRHERKKARAGTEGAKAMSEHKAEREAERAKTERLKALRLAKEASDEIAKRTVPTKKRLSAI